MLNVLRRWVGLHPSVNNTVKRLNSLIQRLEADAARLASNAEHYAQKALSHQTFSDYLSAEKDRAERIGGKIKQLVE